MIDCDSCGRHMFRSEAKREANAFYCSSECFMAGLFNESNKPCPGCAEPCKQCDHEALH